MTVKFAYTPPLDKIRSAMSALAQDQGRSQRAEPDRQRLENTVEIGTEAAERRPDERQPPGHGGRAQGHLRAAAGGKLDFNNAGHDALADRLRDALARNSVPMSEQELQNLVSDLLSTRDTQHSGLITDFSQLSSDTGHECWYY